MSLGHLLRKIPNRGREGTRSAVDLLQILKSIEHAMNREHRLSHSQQMETTAQTTVFLRRLRRLHCQQQARREEVIKGSLRTVCPPQSSGREALSQKRLCDLSEMGNLESDIVLLCPRRRPPMQVPRQWNREEHPAARRSTTAQSPVLCQIKEDRLAHHRAVITVTNATRALIQDPMVLLV